MDKAVLLCCATGHNQANLIPALQLKPQEVWILATPSMTKQAKTLKKVLDRHQINTRILDFDDSSLTSLQNEALRITETITDQHVIFNATGGTKQMVLVIANTLQVLDKDQYSIVYADTTHQRLDWLVLSSRHNQNSEPMQNLLSLDDILAIQGLRLREASSRQAEWVARAEARGQYTRQLGENAQGLGHFFGKINAIAQQAMKTTPPTLRQHWDGPWNESTRSQLKEAERYDLLRLHNERDIEFCNEDSIRYLGGCWLEEYLFFKIRGCTPSEYAINAIICSNDSQSTNEMDAFIVHRNRLLAIECKTLRFGPDDAKNADIIYKLDSLKKRTGGLMQDGLLVSARPLDDKSLARAKDNKIETYAGDDISKLPDKIRNWMTA